MTDRGEFERLVRERRRARIQMLVWTGVLLLFAVVAWLAGQHLAPDYGG